MEPAPGPDHTRRCHPTADHDPYPEPVTRTRTGRSVTSGAHVRASVACTVCHEPIADRRARFCGRCGDPFDASDHRLRGSPTRASGQRVTVRWERVRRVLPGAAMLLIAGIVGTAVAATSTGGWSLARPSAEVALTDEQTGDQLQAAGQIDEQTAAELRDQAARVALRCEPVGCEQWRLTVDEGWSAFASGYGHVALVREPAGTYGAVLELMVVDGASGEEVLRRELDMRDGDGTPADHPAAAFVADGFVLAFDGSITSITFDGATSWDVPAPFGVLWFIEPRADHLLLFVEAVGPPTDVSEMDDPGPRPEPQTRVLALDAADGSVAWEAVGDAFAAPDEGRLLLAEPTDNGTRIRSHDLTDGRIVWERDATQVVYGPLPPALVPVARTRDDGGDLLVDARTGEEVHALGGSLHTSHRDADGSTYLVVDRAGSGLARDDPGGLRETDDQDLEVVALAPDGGLVWRTHVEPPQSGHLRFESHGDRLVLVGDRSGDLLGFDRVTGETAIVQPEELPYDVWTDELGRQVIHGDGSLRIIASDQSVRIIGAQDVWLIGFDPLLVTDGTTLLAVELVADG